MVGRRVASAPLVAGLLIVTFINAQAGEPRSHRLSDVLRRQSKVLRLVEDRS